jgi:hypothetical protein
MSKLLEPLKNQDDVSGYFVECPGCKISHVIYTNNAKGPSWTFNGDFQKPTFSPSLVVRYSWGDEKKQNVCHSFIRDGRWEFLSDCTHSLAGQTVEMIDIKG